MARGRNNATEENGVRLLEADFDDTTAEVDAQETLEREIIAEMGSLPDDVEINIKVYRIPATGKIRPWLLDMPGEMFSELKQKLKDEYGSGTYDVRMYKVGGNQWKRFTVGIELPRNAAPPAIDHGGSALVQMVAQQGALLQSLSTRLLQSPPPSPPPAQDMVGMMTGFAAVMKAMREMNPLPPPPPPPPDPMAIMSSAIEMARGLADSDRPKSMMEVVGEFMQSDLMKTVVQNAQAQQTAPAQIQQRPPQRPQIPAQPGATPPTAAPTPEPAPVTTQSEDEAKFHSLLSMLITMAHRAADPELGADTIEALVDRETLAGMLSLPDPVGMLAQYNPAVATYRGWFVKMIEALTDAGDGVDTESALPPIGNTAPDAPISAPAPVPADGTT